MGSSSVMNSPSAFRIAGQIDFHDIARVGHDRAGQQRMGSQRNHDKTFEIGGYQRASSGKSIGRRPRCRSNDESIPSHIHQMIARDIHAEIDNTAQGSARDGEFVQSEAARSSLTTSPANAAATMATTPSSEELTKKPRCPKLIPRIGTRVLPTRRAVRSMVPSPPRETTISNDETSTCEHVSFTDSIDSGIESSS